MQRCRIQLNASLVCDAAQPRDQVGEIKDREDRFVIDAVVAVQAQIAFDHAVEHRL